MKNPNTQSVHADDIPDIPHQEAENGSWLSVSVFLFLEAYFLIYRVVNIIYLS